MAPSLRLGSIAPDFDAETTAGPINFHKWIGDSWVCRIQPCDFNKLVTCSTKFYHKAILFSHPGDFTPVCTTELGEVARRTSDFAKRNVKVIGISANSLREHHEWVKDINEYGAKFGPTDVQFPVVSSLFSLVPV
jgi:alkyl hydroperoxide reductase subunit AhpC